MIAPGTVWMDCMLIRCANGAAAHRGRMPASTAERVADYIERFPEAEGTSVWFDRRENICFSAAQFRGGPAGKDYNFLSPPAGFLGGMWGERFVIGSLYLNPELSAQPKRVSTDMICSEIPAFSAVAGKRLLLVLGGPSTRRVHWEVFERDLTWSCNKFYLSARVASQPLDVVAIAPDVPLDDNPALDEYLARHRTTLAFEIDRGGPVGSWREINRTTARHPGRAGVFHLRYQSALGLGSRLLVFVLLLGAREVGVVGLDGMSEHGPLHAFERYKSNPGWVERFGLGLQRRQYVILWEHLIALRERLGFTLYNLGEPSPCNASRDITETWFPLPAELHRELEA